MKLLKVFRGPSCDVFPLAIMTRLPIQLSDPWPAIDKASDLRLINQSTLYKAEDLPRSAEKLCASSGFPAM